MPTLPRRKVGDSISAMEQGRLLDYIRSLRPLPSPGSRTIHTTGGVLRVTSPQVGDTETVRLFLCDSITGQGAYYLVAAELDADQTPAGD